jgi:hypothetical protein
VIDFVIFILALAFISLSVYGAGFDAGLEKFQQSFVDLGLAEWFIEHDEKEWRIKPEVLEYLRSKEDR